MLFKELDKLKRSAVMTTIILMFIGFILLLLPETYIPFLSSALGFILLVVLVVAVLDYIGSAKALIHYFRLALGLLAGVVGFALFVFDGLFVSALSWLVGTVPILIGMYGIYHALAFARRSGRRGWWILIILSAAMILFGGVIFGNPWVDSPRAVMQVIGGTLMFSAFVSALRLIWIWPIHND